MPILYKKYENRVKKFITDMIEPETKIIIKDITKKIESTRGQLMNENQPNIKPFVFSKYITDRERIKQKIDNELKNERYIKRNNKNKNKNLFNHSIKNIKLNSSINNSYINSSFITPFTPKSSSLIIDSINKDKDNNSIPVNINQKKSISPIEKGGKKLSNKERQLIDYHIKNDVILQPRMKFKARTDLERIYYTIFNNYSAPKEKKILERQLKGINAINYKTPKDFLVEKYKEEYVNNDNNEKKEKKEKNIINNPYYQIIKNKISLKKKKSNIYKVSKYFYNPKTKNNFEKSWTKRENLNAEAEKILKSYHYKTHFKAAEEIAENTIKNRKNNRYLFLIPNLKKINNSYINHRKSIDEFNSEYKDMDIKINEHDTIYNKSEYKNPYSVGKNRTKYKSELLNKILNIALKDEKKSESKDSRQYSEDNGNKQYKKCKLKDLDFVEIDGKIYNKKEEFDLITRKILKMCKVYSIKNKKNDINLKAGNGKSMITQGMTINDFLKKYQLKKDNS